MKITPIYKNRLITLPAETVLQKLSTATKEELAVLIAVIAEPEFDVKEICQRLDMTENAFKRSLDSWIDAGALYIDDGKAQSETKYLPKSKTDTAKKMTAKRTEQNITLHSTLPGYTSDEMSEIIEKKKGTFELINTCQQILGKVFNAQETAIIIGLNDHLTLSDEYILLLCTHAKQMNKPSVRYIEQLALHFFDNNVITYEALEEELKLIEERVPFESYVRELFGIGKRALIPKEKEFIVKWHDKYKFSRDIVREAYERTVGQTDKPSLKYANAILDNWFAAGYTTIDDIKAAEAERQKKREGDTQQSSFSTDDFYEAALLRSYKENK